MPPFSLRPVAQAKEVSSSSMPAARRTVACTVWLDQCITGKAAAMAVQKAQVMPWIQVGDKH